MLLTPGSLTVKDGLHKRRPISSSCLGRVLRLRSIEEDTCSYTPSTWIPERLFKLHFDLSHHRRRDTLSR